MSEAVMGRSVPLVLIGMAVLFVTSAVRDLLRAEGKLAPARQAWLRMALAFAGVGIGLYFVQLVFG